MASSLISRDTPVIAAPRYAAGRGASTQRHIRPWLLTLICGCTLSATPAPPQGAVTGRAGPTPPAPVATTAPHVVPLPVPGFRDAVVVEPRVSGRRPVIVMLHGMGDSPSSICPAADMLVRGRAWVLCPRGDPYGHDDRGWTYPSDGRRVGAEIHAALDALVAAHPAEVDPSSAVLAGFSLGAMHASFLARTGAAAFPRAFFIDTHNVWLPEQLRRYARDGGRAVAFECSRTYVGDCDKLLHGDGAIPGSPVATRVRHFPAREHGYDATLFDLVRDDFEAVVATDGRWR